MPKQITPAATTHFVATTTPAHLAEYLRAHLCVPSGKVVELPDGDIEMPFCLRGVKGAVTVTTFSVGAKFTLTAPPTSDVDQAVSNAVKIGQIGSMAERAARSDLSATVA